MPAAAKTLVWTGEVPHQKWMNFYMKILSRFALGGRLILRVSAEVTPDGGAIKQQAEETRQALRELGLSDSVDTEV